MNIYYPAGFEHPVLQRPASCFYPRTQIQFFKQALTMNLDRRFVNLQFPGYRFLGFPASNSLEFEARVN